MSKPKALEITRLDIMASLDPALNPGSKPQSLGVANSKSSTSDKLQTFRIIFGISCKYKLIGVQSNHGVEYFGGPAAPTQRFPRFPHNQQFFHNSELL